MKKSVNADLDLDYTLTDVRQKLVSGDKRSRQDKLDSISASWNDTLSLKEAVKSNLQNLIKLKDKLDCETRRAQSIIQSIEIQLNQS
jgi:hypothetical protein